MKCPHCKENMPLLSKICPVCGYVAQSEKVDEINILLHESLTKLKSIPEPTFINSMGSLTYIVYPILFLFMLICGWLSEAGLFWILTLIFLGLSLRAIVKKSKGTLGNELYDNLFKKEKITCEEHCGIAQRLFGKHREVATLLNEITAQIGLVEMRRKNTARRNLFIWVAIVVLIVAGATKGVFSLNTFIEAIPANEIMDETN